MTKHVYTVQMSIRVLQDNKVENGKNIKCLQIWYPDKQHKPNKSTSCLYRIESVLKAMFYWEAVMKKWAKYTENCNDINHGKNVKNINHGWGCGVISQAGLHSKFLKITARIMALQCSKWHTTWRWGCREQKVPVNCLCPNKPHSLLQSNVIEMIRLQ